MRKTAAAPFAARNPSVPAGSRSDASAEIVCLALTVALVALAARIASIW